MTGQSRENVSPASVRHPVPLARAEIEGRCQSPRLPGAYRAAVVRGRVAAVTGYESYLRARRRRWARERAADACNNTGVGDGGLTGMLLPTCAE